jgi:hypothetical protein
MTEKKCTACGEDLSERELLQATKQGALAGAISGGVVAAAFEYIKIKLLGTHG